MKKGVLITVILVLLTGVACAEKKELPEAEKDAKQEAHVYDHRGKRDPFVPLVGATSGMAASLEDIMSIEDVRLQGIASDSTGKRAAIINGEMVREGEGGGHLTVKKILKNDIILLIDDEEYRLSIYKDETE